MAQEYKPIYRFGRFENAGTGTQHDVWDYGLDYNFLTTEEFINISSTSILDTSTGTGARVVQLFGLDNSYAEIDEIITTNGITPKLSTKKFLRLNEIRVLQAGTTGANQGIISAISQESVFYQAQIKFGNNKTLMAIYTVPLNKTAQLLGGIISLNRQGGVVMAREADFEVRVRPYGSVFLNMLRFSCGFGNPIYLSTKIPVEFPQKTDIKLRVVSVESNNTDITGGFELLVKDNS